MKISQTFPSYFLSGDEIMDSQIVVTIREVKQEVVPTRPGKDDEEVIAIYFEDKKRGVRLNKTRAKEIARIHGDETDNWIGKKVKMYTEPQKAFGELHNVIHFTADEMDINDIP
jgi:hypothetical protein